MRGSELALAGDAAEGLVVRPLGPGRVQDNEVVGAARLRLSAQILSVETRIRAESPRSCRSRSRVAVTKGRTHPRAAGR